MTKDTTIGPDEDDPPADTTDIPPTTEHVDEINRIAALLRDRFGVER